MTIRVADRDCFPEPRLAVRQLDGPGGYESGPAGPQRPRRIVGARAQEPGLPVDQVVGLLLRRIGAAVARRQVFEKLDARPRRGAQRGDAQPRPEDVIEALLLGPVVLALPGHFHAET